MPTTLADILKPALRSAGITFLPGTTPSTDIYAEAIPMVNRMMASFSLDGHRIYTSDITDYALTAGQKSYSIGIGGDFNSPRPIFITAASILFPTSPVVRYPLQITLEESVWTSIPVQDITGAPPWLLYYDGGFKQTTVTGLANIYLYPQPPAGYTLELATWSELKDNFTAVTDAVLLPPGYEEMMVWNFAVRLAAMYPKESTLLPDARDMARTSLGAVITSNSKCPDLHSEAARLNNRRGSPGARYGWWLSPF